MEKTFQTEVRNLLILMEALIKKFPFRAFIHLCPSELSVGWFKAKP